MAQIEISSEEYYQLLRIRDRYRSMRNYVALIGRFCTDEVRYAIPDNELMLEREEDPLGDLTDYMDVLYPEEYELIGRDYLGAVSSNIPDEEGEVYGFYVPYGEDPRCTFYKIYGEYPSACTEQDIVYRRKSDGKEVKGSEIHDIHESRPGEWKEGQQE